MLYYARMLYYTILYYTELYCTVPYYTTLYYTMLYYTMLRHILYNILLLQVIQRVPAGAVQQPPGTRRSANMAGGCCLLRRGYCERVNHAKKLFTPAVSVKAKDGGPESRNQ